MRPSDRTRWHATMSQVLSHSPRRHLPLRQAALCLDCEECFELGTAACPVCGSETWTLLTRFLGLQYTAARPGLRRPPDFEERSWSSQPGAGRELSSRR